MQSLESQQAKLQGDLRKNKEKIRKVETQIKAHERDIQQNKDAINKLES